MSLALAFYRMKAGLLGNLTPQITGHLIGAWVTEVGPGPEVVHLEKSDPPPLVQKPTHRVRLEPLHEASLSEGNLGPLYELRQYALKSVEDRARVAALWQQHGAARAALSPIIAAGMETDALSYWSLWAYRSWNERLEVRAAAASSSVWPPPGLSECLESWSTRMLLAMPYSRLQ